MSADQFAVVHMDDDDGPSSRSASAASSMTGSFWPIAGRVGGGGGGGGTATERMKDEQRAMLQHGISVPPVEVGLQRVIKTNAKQPLPHARHNIRFKPDVRDRTKLPRVNKIDVPPIRFVSHGSALSIHANAPLLTTYALQEESARSLRQDVRANLTQSMQGMPPSEIATAMPIAVATGGAQFNAFDKDAKEAQRPQPASITGLFLDVNKTKMFLPAGTPFTYGPGNRVVDSQVDLEHVGDPGWNNQPKPMYVLNQVDNGNDEMAQKPIAQDVMLRLAALREPGLKPLRQGFIIMAPGETRPAPLTPDDLKFYDPVRAFDVMQKTVCQSTDAALVPIADCPGVDAVIAYGLLSSAAGIIRSTEGIDAEAKNWLVEATQITNMAAGKSSNLHSFVHAKKGEDGAALNGALVLLGKAKTMLFGNAPKGSPIAADNWRTTMESYAIGGVWTGITIQLLAADNINKHVLGAIFGTSITPAAPGEGMHWLLF